MLTIAQMFLLNTCTALPCFSRMWSSAASTNVVFSTGLPPATCVPHQGGDAPGWEDTPLRGCEVAPHLLLDPGEVTWEETESESNPGTSWEQPRPTSRWMLRMQHLKVVATTLLRISARPSADWEIPNEGFPWPDFMGEDKLLELFQWSHLWTPILCCLLEDCPWNNWICGHHLTLGCSDPAAS